MSSSNLSKIIVILAFSLNCPNVMASTPVLSRLANRHDRARLRPIGPFKEATPQLSPTANGSPSLLQVRPSSGSILGGTYIELEGSGFSQGMQIYFGGQQASNVYVASATAAYAFTPPGNEGSVEIRLTNPDESTCVLNGGFRYITPPFIFDGDFGKAETVMSGKDLISSFNLTTVVNHFALNSASWILGYTFGLWVDDGKNGGTAGDGRPNGDEVRPLLADYGLGPDSSLGTLNGTLTLAFVQWSIDPPNARLVLWVDDGAGGGVQGDGVMNGIELRTIVGGEQVSLPVLSVFDGHVALAFIDGYPATLKLWLDDGQGGGTPGDFIPNGSEIREIDVNVDGYTLSLNVVNDRLALLYKKLDSQDTWIYLWLDDGREGGLPSDGIVNGGERRPLISQGDWDYLDLLSATSLGSHLALNYSKFRCRNGREEIESPLWIDDGQGGGQKGDGLINGTEIRRLDGANTPLESSLTSVHGTLAMCFVALDGPETQEYLKLWVDHGGFGSSPGNGVMEEREVKIIDGPNRGLSPHLAAIGDTVGVAYYDFLKRAVRFWSVNQLIGPDIASLDPNTGPSNGSVFVEIRGRNFQPGAQVLFGSQWALSVEVINESTMRVLVPPGPAGTVDVLINNPDGNRCSLENAFAYVVPANIDDLAAVKAAPNPMRRSRGENAVVITVPAGSVVKIFDVTGTLVRELRDDGTGAIAWTVNNGEGHSVASGVYLYLVTNPQGETKTGRIGIIQ